MNDDLNLSTLRRQLAKKKIMDLNIHNLAIVMLQPKTKVRYRFRDRDCAGQVLQVNGVPGRTQVRVKNEVTSKVCSIRLVDLTSLVQEN